MVQRCPQCEQQIERDNAAFCSDCGAPVGRTGGDGGIMGVGAAALAGSGAILRRDQGGEGTHLRTVREPAAGGEAAAGGMDYSAALVPLGLQINDNHFYMQGCAAGLDLRLTNRAAAPVRLLELRVEGAGLDVAPFDPADEVLEPDESRRVIVPITPQCFGEPVIHIELHCELGGEVFAFTAQGFIRVLRADEKLPDVVVNIDQSIRAAANARIGYGLSVREQVQADQLRGLIRTTNDLLAQDYPDQWQPVALRLNGRRTRWLKSAYRPPLRVEGDAAAGAAACETACLYIGGQGDQQPRLLLAALPRVRFGRNRANSDLLLRLHPRSEAHDRLSRHVSARAPHFHIELGTDGLLLHDSGSTNGTWLDGRRLAAPVALKGGGGHELDVGGALKLRVDVLGDDGEACPRRRVEPLGPFGRVMDLAAAAGVRAVVITRVGNLEDVERYLLLYQWATLGGDHRADVVVPGLAPGPACLRLHRGGRGFWAEPLAGGEPVTLDGHELAPDSAAPLAMGSELRIADVKLIVGPCRQVGL